MRKKQEGIIRPFIKLLGFPLGVLAILPSTLCASIQAPPPMVQTIPMERGNTDFQSLLNRLSILNEPISREGTGRLIAQGPGEYYRLQFRLIARGPEALRLELFDPFGRPMLYFISYLGETRVFSITEGKEIPFKPSLSGPWSSISQMPITELLKLFWGRVPLFPYDSYQIRPGEGGDKEAIRIFFDGPVQQELWITPLPFSITKSLLKNRKKPGEVEITFSNFSTISGQRIPLQFEIKEGTGENALTIRYETLILRPDIPEDTFRIPDPTPKPSNNKS